MPPASLPDVAPQGAWAKLTLWLAAMVSSKAQQAALRQLQEQAKQDPAWAWEAISAHVGQHFPTWVQARSLGRYDLMLEHLTPACYLRESTLRDRVCALGDTSLVVVEAPQFTGTRLLRCEGQGGTGQLWLAVQGQGIRYTLDTSDMGITQGDLEAPVPLKEVWKFRRQGGGPWLLDAWGAMEGQEELERVVAQHPALASHPEAMPDWAAQSGVVGRKR